MVNPVKNVKIVKKRRKIFKRHQSDRYKSVKVYATCISRASDVYRLYTTNKMLWRTFVGIMEKAQRNWQSCSSSVQGPASNAQDWIWVEQKDQTFDAKRVQKVSSVQCPRVGIVAYAQQNLCSRNRWVCIVWWIGRGRMGRRGRAYNCTLRLKSLL